MKNYDIIKEVGRGAFSIVLKAIHKKKTKIVAVKQMNDKFKTFKECTKLREVKSLMKLKHKNIIKLLEVILIKGQLSLVFEFMDQNLFDWYKITKENGKKIEEEVIRHVIFSVISALSHMHKHGYFHRDLKPENIMICKGNNVRLCDFGLAREIRSRPPYTDYVSTRWYRAPEILLKSTVYNSPVDIFAIGCIMAELYLQSPLFNGNSEID